MKASDFIASLSDFTLECGSFGSDAELVKITADSREVMPGSVFFCV